MVKLRGGADKLTGILKGMVLWCGWSLSWSVPNTFSNMIIAGLLN
jgi:hypothetical protein